QEYRLTRKSSRVAGTQGLFQTSTLHWLTATSTCIFLGLPLPCARLLARYPVRNDGGIGKADPNHAFRAFSSDQGGALSLSALPVSTSPHFWFSACATKSAERG